jgi:SAM-dependent methyltransferase
MTYAMGRSTAETDRLRLQARMYAGPTRALLLQAGIAPGMRVLDVGSGAGDVAFELARIVGESGEVVGIDADPEMVAAAESAGSGARFAVGTLAEPGQTGPFDAVTGRLILMHVPDPVAAVRGLARLVRPGGIVTFQDFAVSRAHTVPPLPLFARVRDWVMAALAAAGARPDAGHELPGILREAGLADVEVAVGTPGSADPAGLTTQHAAATVASLAPLLLAHGLATESDLADLHDRIRAEAEEAGGAVMFSPDLVAAWGRVQA